MSAQDGAARTDARLDALRQLSGGDALQFRAALIEAFDDSDWQIREYAIAVGPNAIPQEELFAWIAHALTEAQSIARKNVAIELLTGLGRAAESWILDRLRHSKGSIRKHLLDALKGLAVAPPRPEAERL